jgi:uncharacterized protein
MHTQQSIDLIAKRIAAASSSPAKVILIGSYARGEATEASDLDLLVLQKEFTSKASEYQRLISEVHTLSFNVDLILMREEDFEWKSLVGGTLPYWAKKEGRLLHDFQ